MGTKDDLHQKFTENESSLIREVKYQADREVLEVRLAQETGEERVYFYEEVPRWAVVDFLAADSKGRYYNRNIKGEYETFSH